MKILIVYNKYFSLANFSPHEHFSRDEVAFDKFCETQTFFFRVKIPLTNFSTRQTHFVSYTIEKYLVDVQNFTQTATSSLAKSQLNRGKFGCDQVGK